MERTTAKRLREMIADLARMTGEDLTLGDRGPVYPYRYTIESADGSEEFRGRYFKANELREQLRALYLGIWIGRGESTVMGRRAG